MNGNIFDFFFLNFEPKEKNQVIRSKLGPKSDHFVYEWVTLVGICLSPISNCTSLNKTNGGLVSYTDFIALAPSRQTYFIALAPSRQTGRERASAIKSV